MAEFITALRDPDIAFLRYALMVALLGSVAFGMIGTYVVARRITYIGGAIAHCALGGIGAALYLRHEMGVQWCGPMCGAVVASLLAALVIGLVSIHGRDREDTVIGAVWAVGMAVGLLFLAKTHAYVDPMSYLFGRIVYVSRNDVWLVAGLDVLVVGLSVLFHDRLVAMCFDEEFAELRGVRADRYYLLLLCLTALTVVLMVSVVGIVMVVALLTLPAAVAGQLSRRIWQMMVLAVVCCMVFTTTGLGLSYAWDLPSGPVIIILCAMVYLVVVFGTFVLRRRTNGG
jgi:zinc transport system permease protein